VAPRVIANDKRRNAAFLGTVILAVYADCGDLTVKKIKLGRDTIDITPE
jgi:hypothetical protein